jgi:hypothetical protein
VSESSQGDPRAGGASACGSTASAEPPNSQHPRWQESDHDNLPLSTPSWAIRRGALSVAQAGGPPPLRGNLNSEAQSASPLGLDAARLRRLPAAQSTPAAEGHLGALPLPLGETCRTETSNSDSGSVSLAASQP